MKIEVSDSEILDKFSILEIKNKLITDPYKLLNIKQELDYLQVIACDILENILIRPLYTELKNINQELWNIENDIRIKESKQEFDDEFIYLARKVYLTNDKRASIKKQINLSTKSQFIEEKSYEKY